jgi:sugar phosphate isomerase/epimerase
MNDSERPRFSLCQLGLPLTTMSEDIAICSQIGADGLSVDVNKLGDPRRDREIVEAMRQSGVAASICVPAVMSFLPMPAIPGPDDLDRRYEAIIDGIRRLSAFEPSCVFVLTGPALPGEPEAASRRRVLEGLRGAAAEARESGMRLAVEPMRPALRDLTSLVCSVDECIALLDEAGLPEVGIVLDTWHLWDSPTIESDIEQHVDRIYGIQISDYRPPRTFADRFLPGDGDIDWTTLLGRLIAAGYRGYYDLEVFSDDGRYGVELPDSLWKRDTAEWTGRARDQFLDLYSTAHATAANGA